MQIDVANATIKVTPTRVEGFRSGHSRTAQQASCLQPAATERTIKAHRRQVMDKPQADSLAHLVRIADQLGIEPISRKQREELSGVVPSAAEGSAGRPVFDTAHARAKKRRINAPRSGGAMSN
jgi:hypothetical protein